MEERDGFIKRGLRGGLWMLLRKWRDGGEWKDKSDEASKMCAVSLLVSLKIVIEENDFFSRR